MIQALITGSRAYGTPRPDSDLDMVLHFDKYEDFNLLLNSKIYDTIHVFQHDSSVSLRIGKLNLICVLKQESFTTWVSGTQQLKKIAPVTKDLAISAFESLGIPRHTKSDGSVNISTNDDIPF